MMLLRPLSLNNQDKVENYLKPMKNQGFQPFSRILLVEKALSKFWPLGLLFRIAPLNGLYFRFDVISMKVSKATLIDALDASNWMWS
jgi:hypothetical protein